MRIKDTCQLNNILDHIGLICILVKIDAYSKYEIVEIKIIIYPAPLASF
jgi:hypothetical protein